MQRSDLWLLAYDIKHLTHMRSLTSRILDVAHPGLNRVNLSKFAALNKGLSLTIRLII